MNKPKRFPHDHAAPGRRRQGTFFTALAAGSLMAAGFTTAFAQEHPSTGSRRDTFEPRATASAGSANRSSRSGPTASHNTPQSGAGRGGNHGDRGRSSRGYHGNSRSRHYRGGFRGSIGFYSPYWFGWPWYGTYGGWWGSGDGGYGGVYRDAEGDELGAVDLDVRPEEARIYVDGEYVGVADDYDGFPRYLWLRSGTRHVVIFQEGFKTLAKRVHVRPGVILQIDDRMEPGLARPPEELFASLAPEPEEERSVVAPERARVEPRERAGATDREVEREEPWRQRSDVPRADGARVNADQRAEPGRLILQVTPSDAAIYLDGRFLGSAEALSRLRSALLVDAGEHVLEVSRPGFVPASREFTVRPGEEAALDVALTQQ